MTTITATPATPATITELYAERAAGETTAAMLTDGRDILDISRNDDGSFHLWTSLGEVSNVAGGRMVIAPPARTTATPVITYRLPYDATTRDHNCLVTIEGEPEQSIGYAPTFHEAEKKCRQYIDDLLASDLFRPASELDDGSNQDAIAAEYAAVIGDPTRDVDERYCERCTRVTVHRLVAKYGTFFCGSCSVCACGTLAIYGGVTPCCQACHDQALAEMDDQPADDPGHAITLLDGGSGPDEIAAALPIEACACSFPINESGFCSACSAFPGDYMAATLEALQAHAAEYAAALPKPCATCGSDGSPCVDCNPAPADHNLITPDPAECPDISAPQPLNDLPRCEQRAVAPSLALWGPDTPKCTDCGTRHDPILDCPGGRETSDLFFDRLCNQASDLVTRLVLEKSRLAHGPIVCNDHIARETRIWRLNRIIDRAARRLGRRFIAQMQLGSTIDVSRVTDVPFVVPAPEPVPAWLTAAPVTQCANCDGLHHIQRCPEVWRALTG